jgi:hypothetical protein
MALVNWLSKAQLTINSSAVPHDTVDMPVLLVYDNFPSEITGSSGGCMSDGRDIRFSTDELGNNELPREIVNIDKDLDILTVYVKIPSISASTDTIIYVFWNNVSADEPGPGAASEAKLVWSEWYGAFHFTNIVNDWKGILDSSGAWSNMTPIGTPDTTIGHADGTTAASLSNTFGLSLHEFMNFAGLTNELMFWCNLKGGTTGNIATGTNGIPMGWLGSGQFGIGWGLTSTTTNAVPTTGWHHVWLRNVAGTCRCYVDGIDKTQGTGTAAAINFTTFGLGSGTAVWDVSEIRMRRGVNTPVTYTQTMISNESNPSAFITPGITQTVVVGFSLTISGLVPNTEVRVYDVNTGDELTGIENSLDIFQWNYEYSADFNVNIIIHNLNYKHILIKNFTLSNSNVVIPIQQIFDRTYQNP